MCWLAILFEDFPEPDPLLSSIGGPGELFSASSLRSLSRWSSLISSISACTSACSCALSPSTAASAVSKSDIAVRAASSSSASRAALGRALARASALDITCREARESRQGDREVPDGHRLRAGAGEHARQ